MTDLDARYGARRTPRWFWPVFAAVGIALGVALAAWIGFQDKPVTAKVWAYDVRGEHDVTVTLDVVRPDPLTVTCTVYAQAADHSIVGEKSVEIPASNDETERVDIPIETERRAVTGVLRTCVPTD